MALTCSVKLQLCSASEGGCPWEVEEIIPLQESLCNQNEICLANGIQEEKRCCAGPPQRDEFHPYLVSVYNMSWGIWFPRLCMHTCVNSHWASASVNISVAAVMGIGSRGMAEPGQAHTHRFVLSMASPCLHCWYQCSCSYTAAYICTRSMRTSVRMWTRAGESHP